VKAQQVDPRDCIVTNDEYTCAAPLMTETFARTQQSLRLLLDERVVPVVGGFVGATREGATTTLGRGGSDYTAAILGAALRSEEIQIWTDVTGVLTADPRVVPDAQTVERRSLLTSARKYCIQKQFNPRLKIASRCGFATHASRTNAAHSWVRKRKRHHARSKQSRTKKA
jgi:glutamate 5-kinase